MPSSFALPNVLVQKRRYAILRQLLVIALCYLILLSATLIWKIYLNDITNRRMDHLSIFAKLVDVIEKHISVDLSIQDAFVLAISNWDFVDSESEHEHRLYIVIILNCALERLAQIWIGAVLDFEVSMLIWVAHYSSLPAKLISAYLDIHLSRQASACEVLNVAIT